MKRVRDERGNKDAVIDVDALIDELTAVRETIVHTQGVMRGLALRVESIMQNLEVADDSEG